MIIRRFEIMIHPSNYAPPYYAVTTINEEPMLRDNDSPTKNDSVLRNNDSPSNYTPPYYAVTIFNDDSPLRNNNSLNDYAVSNINNDSALRHTDSPMDVYVVSNYTITNASGSTENNAIVNSYTTEFTPEQMKSISEKKAAKKAKHDKRRELQKQREILSPNTKLPTEKQPLPSVVASKVDM